MIVSPLPPYFLTVYIISQVQGFVHFHHLSYSLVYLLKFFFCPFQKWSRLSFKGAGSGIYLFDEIPAAELGFDKLSRSSEINLCHFYIISVCLMVLPIFPSTCNFPFLRTFWFCLDLTVLFLYRFSLLAGHIFLCQIPFLYSDLLSHCLYYSL